MAGSRARIGGALLLAYLLTQATPSFADKSVAPARPASDPSPSPSLSPKLELDGPEAEAKDRARLLFQQGVTAYRTGKYYEASDTGTAPQINSFYGIYDDNTNTHYVSKKSLLNPVKITPTSDGKAYTFSSDSYALGYSSPRKPGWKLDFLDQTEKQVTAAVTADGIIYFNTITGSDGCGSNGSSRSYALRVFTGMPATGTLSGVQSSTGLLGAPSLLVTSITVGDRDSVGGTVTQKVTTVLSAGAQGLTVTSPTGSSNGVSTSSRQGRQSWREIKNFVLNTK